MNQKPLPYLRSKSNKFPDDAIAGLMNVNDVLSVVWWAVNVQILYNQAASEAAVNSFQFWQPEHVYEVPAIFLLIKIVMTVSKSMT